MDKRVLLPLIEKTLLAKRDTAQSSLDQAHQDATHEESKPETQYDTVGLEASYLAHGQAVRLSEYQKHLNELSIFGCLFEEKHEVVKVASLVVLMSDHNKAEMFFIYPCLAGLKLYIGSKSITLVTPSSPLGKLLLNKEIDDEIELKVNNHQHHFYIEEIF